jgi:hypothetical protein
VENLWVKHAVGNDAETPVEKASWCVAYCQSRLLAFAAIKAIAKLETSVRVPSIDFAFKSDTLDMSKCDFAVMGEEVNGKYYEPSKS